MSVLLLIIIYVAFISLGLPDSLLGSGWPIISVDLNTPLSTAGLISMVISLGTVISSIMSDFLYRKLGTHKIVVASVFLTAVSLLGFYFSYHVIWFFVLAIPLGIGAGAIDAALNHYVANHFKAKHMNWLHSFWGIGATISPLIMGFAIASTPSWRNGYLIVGIIQSILVIVLILTKFLWQKNGQNNDQVLLKSNRLKDIKGLVPGLLTFFGYCALEASAGLWGASYLVNYQNLLPAHAAMVVSTYYLGITVGRFINGFLTYKFDNRQLIRFGFVLITIGIVLLIFKSEYLFFIGFVLVGLGLSPIYPSMLHETPKRFGANNSSKLMGLQMASAYIGTMTMPMLTGFITGFTGFWIYAMILCVFLILMIISNEFVNKLAYKAIESNDLKS